MSEMLLGEGEQISPAKYLGNRRQSATIELIQFLARVRGKVTTIRAGV